MKQKNQLTIKLLNFMCYGYSFCENLHPNQNVKRQKKVTLSRCESFTLKKKKFMIFMNDLNKKNIDDCALCKDENI